MLSLRSARVLLLPAAAAAIALLLARLVPAVPAAALPGLVPSLLLVLVTGIGALVATYAVRNLEGQERLARFAALEVVAVAALSLVVLSPTLPLLALGWTVGGLAIAALVAHAGTEEARTAASTVRLRLLAGDLVLWIAVAVIGLELGTWRVDGLDEAVADASPVWVAVAAVLVIAAGAARSALVPAHRWLPETAAAPSPVSALLHAGLVNGIGLLALLLWPVVSASTPARALLIVVAVTTIALGTAQLRSRPDVKGRLAGSTSAQMGYLGVQVALGLPAAVLAHMVGHGLWKASLFLGAGGAVGRERSATPTTAVPGRRRRLAAAVDVVVGVGVVLVLAEIPVPWAAPLLEGPAALVPVGVAALAAVLALRAARAERHGLRAYGFASAIVLLAVSAYVLGLRALTTAVETTVPLATPSWGEPGSAEVVALVVALAGLAVAAWRVDRAARLGQLPALAAAVSRTSLPPASLHELVGGPPPGGRARPRPRSRSPRPTMPASPSGSPATSWHRCGRSTRSWPAARSPVSSGSASTTRSPSPGGRGAHRPAWTPCCSSAPWTAAGSRTPTSTTR